MIARILKLLFILGLLFVAGWLLYEARTILMYILIAVVVSLIGSPLVNALDSIEIKGRRLPHSLKAGLTLLVIFAIFGLLGWLFIPLIIAEATVLARFDPEQIERSIAPLVEQLNAFLMRFNPEHDHFDAAELLGRAFNQLDISLVPTLLNSIAGAFGGFLIALFSVAFISFFFLSERQIMPRAVLSFVPRAREQSAINIMRNTRITLSRYFVGLLIQVVAVSVVVYIGLSIVGIKHALIIAIFSGLANLVPYLGPWIGASFGIFIMLTNNIDASFAEVIKPKLIGLVIVFVAAQLIDNYVFQPKIFSSSIHAHPLEIFLVILVAGTMGGVGAMIAAIPVYSFLRIVFVEMDKEFLWMKRLKGAEEEPL